MSWRACSERGRHGSNGLRCPLSCLSAGPGNAASRWWRVSSRLPRRRAVAAGGFDYRRRAAARSALVAARDREAVVAAAHGLDRLEGPLGVELLAQAADEDFQHVGVAVEVLLVDVLGEVGLRDQFTGVHHQVLE